MDPVLDIAVRAALSLLLGAAALHKLRDLATFRATFGEYRLLPPRLARLFPAAEAGLAIGLLVRPRPSLVGTAALLALYGGAIAVNLRRGRRHIDCGCGGPGRPISGRLVARNAALAAIALAALLPSSGRALVWLDAITVAATTAFAAAVYASLDRMIADAPALARVRGTA
jgi:hypothetical protein